MGGANGAQNLRATNVQHGARLQELSLVEQCLLYGTAAGTISGCVASVRNGACVDSVGAIVVMLLGYGFGGLLR